MPGGPDLLDAIRAGLRSGANPERAVGQQRYMKSEMPFLGLTSPQRHELLAPLLADPALRIDSRSEWERSIRELWDGAQFREDRYAALALLRHRTYRSWRDPDVMPLVEHLVVTGAWWDHVDEVGNVVGEVLLLDPEGEGLRMRAWSEREDLWLRRSAIISQLRHRDRTDTTLLEDVIEPNLDDREFFIRKAIGWVLRDVGKRRPTEVADWLAPRTHRASGVTMREATKYLPPADAERLTLAYREKRPA